MAEEKESSRYIVRIAGKDLNGKFAIPRALTGIKGIGQRMAMNIAIAFEKQSGVNYELPIGKLPEELDKKLEEIVLAPQKFGIPSWAFNRKNDPESGENIHFVQNELDFSLRQDLQRMSEIKSYKGLRHTIGLPVRGQKTKSTHRGKGPVVGVTKKDIIKAQAPAKAGAVPEKKEEKKK